MNILKSELLQLEFFSFNFYKSLLIRMRNVGRWQLIRLKAFTNHELISGGGCRNINTSAVACESCEIHLNMNELKLQNLIEYKTRILGGIIPRIYYK